MLFKLKQHENETKIEMKIDSSFSQLYQQEKRKTAKYYLNNNKNKYSSKSKKKIQTIKIKLKESNIKFSNARIIKMFRESKRKDILLIKVQIET